MGFSLPEETKIETREVDIGAWQFRTWAGGGPDGGKGGPPLARPNLCPR